MNKSKYNNKKTEVDGIVFDSKKEAEYYKVLKQKELDGEIYQLDRQIRFEIIPGYIRQTDGKKIRPSYYIADFTYLDNRNRKCMVDTKGFRTQVYKLKRKAIEYLYSDWIFIEV